MPLLVSYVMAYERMIRRQFGNARGRRVATIRLIIAWCTVIAYIAMYMNANHMVVHGSC